MKRLYLISIITLMLAMLFLPLAAGAQSEAKPLPVMANNKTEPEVATKKTIKVLHKESNTVEEVALDDYLFSVVAAEMPALYENEALKAQTVAAYTYMTYKSDGNNGYDITDDSSVDQAYVTREAVREKWGDKADEYEGKIKSAINSVLGERICFENEPILAAYHAISGGKTENAAEVWGGNYSYLSAVDSSWDKLSDGYLSTVSLSPDELKEKLKGSVSLEGDAGSWIGEIKKSSSGTVLDIVLSGKNVTGSSIRTSLSLRSANFDVSFSDGKFTFSVYGYGHGIGMSQNGANYMAKQGKTYKDILSHYYSGCTVS